MINKGIESISDNKHINEHMADDNKRIPFTHMIYFGDGATDIPCMKLLRQQGGYAIAIYEENNKKQVDNAVDLVERNIINFACNADYSKDSTIYKTLKTIIKQIKLLDDHLKAQKDFENLQEQNHTKTKDIKRLQQSKKGASTPTSDLETKHTDSQKVKKERSKHVKVSQMRFNMNNNELLWLLLGGEF